MDSRPLIREALQIMTLIGFNPLYNTLIYSIWEKFIVFFTFAGLFDGYFALILNYRGIDSTMEVMIVVAITQITVKMLFFFVNKVEIKLLITNTNMFWQRNFVYFDQEEENEKIFSFAKSCIRLYIVFILTVLVLYLTKPLVFVEFTALPWITTCCLFFGFKICYAFEILEAVTYAPIIMAFDLLYISLIINIICEFKILKRHFPNLRINPMVRGTDKEAMDDLKILIDHHNLILQCIKIMKHVYSVPLLGVFLSDMFGMCFSLLILTSSDVDYAIKPLFGMSVIYYLIHLFVFCTFGSMLADESVTITNEVYKSKWWIKTQPELRKALVMVMRRANRPEILTACGFFQVDLQTFTAILRNTFSFFTFMQVMYDT